jgi:hypothetical protein
MTVTTFATPEGRCNLKDFKVFLGLRCITAHVRLLTAHLIKKLKLNKEALNLVEIYQKSSGDSNAIFNGNILSSLFSICKK